MTKQGETKEYTAVMEQDGEGFKTTHRGEGPAGDWTGNFTGDELPDGDVSIHSHPTGTAIKDGILKWGGCQ